MAPSTPPDIIVSDGLSNLRIADSVATMHHDTPKNMDQPTESNRVKLTLETLPPEIKNEIFSHLLLAAKVKYSTNGSWPGNKYKFNTTIMRVNKQLKEDATSYSWSQNEFALISSKFFAFEIDRKRFLPTVATGKAARTIKTPAIEATITHVGGTLCRCCNPMMHKAKDRATHALFLVADLEHLMRELRLTYHIWPSKPIYIVSEVNVSPIEYIPINVNTEVKVVWKVNPPHRQDLTVAELRARQTRLLTPLDFPTGCGKKISFVGVDKDIAREFLNQDMPRILPVDAVGLDLFNLLKAQKRHLDTLLYQEQSPCLHDIIHSYTDLACAGWPLDIRGHWRNASVTTYVDKHGKMTSVCLMPLDKLDDEDYQAKVLDSWQLAVLCLVVDCLFTITQIRLKEGSYSGTNNWVDLIATVQCYTFRGNDHQLFPGSLKALLSHYVAWLMTNEKERSRDEAVSGGLDMMEMARSWIHADDQDDVWHHLNEDWEFLHKCGAGHTELQSKDFGRFPIPRTNFRGLLSRPRVHNTLVHLKPSREVFQGWTTKRDFPKPKVATQMIKFVDDFIETKPAERDQEWDDKALTQGHIPIAFVNLPDKRASARDEGSMQGPSLPDGLPPLPLGFGMEEIGGVLHMFEVPEHDPFP